MRRCLHCRKRLSRPPLRCRPPPQPPSPGPPRPTALCGSAIWNGSRSISRRRRRSRRQSAQCWTIYSRLAQQSCWRRCGPSAMRSTPATTFRSATSAPARRGRTPDLTRWHCWWTPPTRGTYSWKPGSTLTASRPGRPRRCAAQARRGCTRTGSGTPTPARISTPPTRTCGSTLPTGWGSCAQGTLWTASTLTTIFTPPPTRPLTRRTTRPAAAH